jgi:putative transposase
MKKTYQITTSSAAIRAGDQLPDAVSVSMAELAGSMREGLLALAVGAGLQVMDAILEESVVAVAGPRGRHDQGRTVVRHGTEQGAVTLGGRRVPITRPRVRTKDNASEVAIPAYELFSSVDVLNTMVLERMLAKLSCRRYPSGLEPVGTGIDAIARSTSRSAISRRFVKATETALAGLMAADLSGCDLVAIMVDGVHFAGHLCVVALGIGADGTKHPLGLAEGATENTTVVAELLSGLRERGLDTTRPTLFVLDGAKALTAAVRAVFDHPVIQRCQLHKIRNVEAKLPKAMAATVATKMRAAYANPDTLRAESELETLARELAKSHPGAAGSLREGLAETLTVARLGVPPMLARTLRSTNAVESMIEICRDHSSNVKRWRDGEMALRWCAAGMVEASKQFRRVNGHLHLAVLRKALDAHVAKVTPTCEDEEVAA